MRKGDNIRERADGRFEARYIKGHNENGKAIYGYCYGKTREEAAEKREWQLRKNNKITGPRLMTLLILGAGSHGHEVYEIAEEMRCFSKISYLDDFKKNSEIVGKCSDLESFTNEYTMAIPAIGSGELRKKWTQAIIKAGYVIPTLIDPTAVVSKTANIGYATVVGSMAAINAGAHIGNGCIVSSGAIISRDAMMEDWQFINSGETLLKKKLTKTKECEEQNE